MQERTKHLVPVTHTSFNLCLRECNNIIIIKEWQKFQNRAMRHRDNALSTQIYGYVD